MRTSLNRSLASILCMVVMAFMVPKSGMVVEVAGVQRTVMVVPRSLPWIRVVKLRAPSAGIV